MVHASDSLQGVVQAYGHTGAKKGLDDGRFPAGMESTDMNAVALLQFIGLGQSEPSLLSVSAGCCLDQGQIHAMKAFRMSHKQISPGYQLLRKPLNEFFLC